MKRNRDTVEKKTNEEVTAERLADLKKRMQTVNWLFHFTRNNPRNRNRFYYSLVRIVGFDRWANLDKRIRLEWESSKNSFDRMYGLAKEFSSGRDYYAVLFSKTEIEDTETLKHRVNALEDKVNGINLTPIKKDIEKINKGIGELEKSVYRTARHK